MTSSSTRRLRHCSDISVSPGLWSSDSTFMINDAVKTVLFIWAETFFFPLLKITFFASTVPHYFSRPFLNGLLVQVFTTIWFPTCLIQLYRWYSTFWEDYKLSKLITIQHHKPSEHVQWTWKHQSHLNKIYIVAGDPQHMEELEYKS